MTQRAGSRSSVLEVVALTLAVLTTGACGADRGAPSGSGTRSCSTSADCASGERCVDGVCHMPMTPNRDGGTPADGAMACFDGDGDGFGRGCLRGPDCDDTNPLQTGIEVCDGHDNDCDGESDEGVGSPYCMCELGCREDGIGPHGSGMSPFTPGEGTSDAVGLDDQGSLVLQADSIDTNIIWVANSGEGSVSKIDTRTYEQLARYRTGSDPSRSSVNTLGDVFIGNRGGMSLVKISALGDRCPDTNGDGVITTSHGAELLDFGQDDCVLWRTDLTGHGIIRSVAAQDIVGPDGEIRPYVWAGGWDGVVWKLDGTTGAILIDATPSPALPYGFALDGSGNLWISGNQSPALLGRIDTNRCVDSASCAADVCGTDMGAAGDACVKQAIQLPGGASTYGITVDFRQRVWLGATVTRYDPSQPWDARWTVVGADAFIHGIAADTAGWVWGAGYGSGVLRVNADDPSMHAWVPGTEGLSAKGMAIDSDGKVWAINHGHNNATVITPGPTMADAVVEAGVAPYFSTPYTYSDMTGAQLRNATRPHGWYRTTFAGCDMQDTEWGQLYFDATVPARTSLLFRVRTADTLAGLESAVWVIVAAVPTASSPAEIGAALEAMHVTAGKYLQLEVQLNSEVAASVMPITPIVHGMSVTHVCPPIIG